MNAFQTVRTVYEKSGVVNASKVRFDGAGVAGWRRESLNVPCRQGLGADVWFKAGASFLCL